MLSAPRWLRRSFRDRLETASGFQSVQFRELEFVLGYRRADMGAYFASESTAAATLKRRLSERSVVDHFYDFLEPIRRFNDS